VGQKEKKKGKKGIIAIVLLFFLGFFTGVMVGIRLGEREKVALDTTKQIGDKLLEGNASELITSKELPLTFYEKLQQEGAGPRVEDTQPLVIPQAPVEVKKRESKELSKEAFFLQVGAFKDQRNAKLLIDRLHSQGYEVSIYPARVRGEVWYRVCVKASSSKEAEETMGRLKKEGFTEVRVLKGE